MYDRKRNTHIEDEIFPYATIKKDLRPELIVKARKMAIIKDENHVWKELDDLELLKSAKLYLEDKRENKQGLTLGAILLFGNDIAIGTVAPSYKTDAIVRKYDIDRYDDRDDIRTNLIDSYDRLMMFIKKTYKRSFLFRRNY